MSSYGYSGLSEAEWAADWPDAGRDQELADGLSTEECNQERRTMSTEAWKALLASGILEDWGWYDEQDNFVIDPVDLPNFIQEAYHYLLKKEML